LDNEIIRVQSLLPAHKIPQKRGCVNRDHCSGINSQNSLITPFFNAQGGAARRNAAQHYSISKHGFAAPSAIEKEMADCERRLPIPKLTDAERTAIALASLRRQGFLGPSKK